MIIGGLAAAVVVLTGGYDRLRDYVEQWTGDRFLPEATNGQVFGSSPSSGSEDMEPGLPELVRERNSQVIRHTGYTVSYNAETKIPNWVAWTLTPERVVHSLLQISTPISLGNLFGQRPQHGQTHTYHGAGTRHQRSHKSSIPGIGMRCQKVLDFLTNHSLRDFIVLQHRLSRSAFSLLRPDSLPQGNRREYLSPPRYRQQ